MGADEPSRLIDRLLDTSIWLLVVALVVPVGFAGWAIGHYTGHTKTVTVAGTSTPPPSSIQAAPAFSAGDLTALPTDNWITNGGSLANERYSPLTEITQATSRS